MRNSIYKIWRFCLPFIFIIIFIHFLKDITQDILRIPTILDLLGNINEDLSLFPPFIQQLFIAFGYISYIIEIFLIVAMPKIIMKKAGLMLEKLVVIFLVFLGFYFISALLLDPRYHF